MTTRKGDKRRAPRAPREHTPAPRDSTDLARATIHNPESLTNESVTNAVPPPASIREGVARIQHRLRSRYRNPFRKVRGLIPFRIDMGVDYGGAGPVYPLGSAVIVRLDTNASWPGGHYIAYRLRRGPLRGKVIYLAENLRFPHGLHIGKRIRKGTKIAELLAPFPHCETGLARDVAGYPPLAYGCYSEGERTAAGDYMSDLLHSTGAPRGTTSGRPTTCKAAPYGPHAPEWPKL